MGRDGQDAERITTTLTRAQKAQLERLAKAEGVKVAWLVRRCVERYLAESDRGPTLPLNFGEDDAKR
ncbi:MAG: CopG family transcriptional regulator [Gammaproteobacteria bacterium]